MTRPERRAAPGIASAIGAGVLFFVEGRADSDEPATSDDQARLHVTVAPTSLVLHGTL